MFAELGEIKFQVVGSPEHLEAERRYDYAEHDVIEAPPRLQWLSNGLERLVLDLIFHASFSNPTSGLAALRAAANAHQALPLVMGDGTLWGYFVIESIATRSTQLGANGTAIAVGARLELKEFAPGAELDPSAPPLAPFTPLALVNGAAASGSAATGASSSTPLAPLSPQGVTAILSNAPPAGAITPNLLPDDVPISVITRSAAR
ncbi:MAG TPA: phage tail protein [Candidatus Binataceae bacterium]|nr:phage tail protein [Candidatus Binataceae bacterium]